MDGIVYEETQVTRFRFPMVLVILVVFCVAGWQSWNAEHNPAALIAILFITPLAVIVLWNLTVLRVIITPTDLQFGSFVFRKRFPLRDIRVGQIEHIPVLAGIGIHNWMGRWVFNARFGRGVNVEVGKRRYLIGSDHPEQLQNALLHAVPRREAQ